MHHWQGTGHEVSSVVITHMIPFRKSNVSFERHEVTAVSQEGFLAA